MVPILLGHIITTLKANEHMGCIEVYQGYECQDLEVILVNCSSNPPKRIIAIITKDMLLLLSAESQIILFDVFGSHLLNVIVIRVTL